MTEAPSFRSDVEMFGAHALPVVRRGPDEGPLVLILQPLFEEMNRCRRLLADIGAALARRGIASILPDLPATGDHDAIAAPDWHLWQDAVATMSAQLGSTRHLVLFGLRGGGLLAGAADAPRLYALAPPRSGERLLVDMMRAQAIADQERTGAPQKIEQYRRLWNRGESVRLIGYPISAAMAQALGVARLPDGTARIRAIGSGGDALPGPLVWRQAEPDRALPLAETVADDVERWIGA